MKNEENKSEDEDENEDFVDNYDFLAQASLMQS
jgi:hypothetical protein